MKIIEGLKMAAVWPLAVVCMVAFIVCMLIDGVASIICPRARCECLNWIKRKIDDWFDENSM
jgi:hypothetical protein